MDVREVRALPKLTRLYAKAVVTGLAGGDGLPDTGLVVRDLEVDRDHLAAYARVCGYRLRDEVPPTYPHVLAFPLAVELMSDRSFPFPLPGLVHIGNTITQHRPLGAAERPTIEVRARDLRPHRSGRQFDVEAELTVDGGAVWTGVSTYLKRGGGSEDAPSRSIDAPAGRPTAVWEVAADTGRRYAAVSGDVNPIHLNPLAARLFGFPRQIAHGMWTAARCLAALEGKLPPRSVNDVRFEKPLVLPADVAFTAESGGGGWRFAVTDPDRDRRYLVGSVTAVT